MSSSDPRFSHDPELEFLQDRELLELASLLRSRRLPEPPLDPAFRSSLRRDLRRRHFELIEPQTSWWRRLTSGPGLAWSGAAAGALAIAVAVVFALHPPASDQRTILSSPLDHMRNVAVVQPMKLTFQTAMDHQSVETSLHIQPATQVTYNWQGNTLYVQPVAGQLAPNTQYKLTLSTSAKTQGGQPIQQPAQITFVTGAVQPAATPPPVSPSPVQTGVALANSTQIAPAGAVRPAWSPDGKTIYFAAADGSLESVPAAGGTPVSLGVQGVRGVAVAADGSRLALLTTAGVTLLKPDGTGAQLFPLPDAVAVGWRDDTSLVALPTGVFELKASLDRAHPATPFSETADAAVFSPDGTRLLLNAGGNVHLVTLQSGQDTAWPAGTAVLPVWSHDGSQVAYAGSGGLTLAAPDGTGATVVASPEQLGTSGGATGLVVAWSDGAILVGGPDALSGLDTMLRTPVQLASGRFSAVEGSPSGSTVAYVQNGELNVASLRHPGLQPQLEGEAAGALKTFMDARVAGDSDGAHKLLAGAALQKYSKAPLVFTGRPRLARWFSVFAQARPDGSVVEVVRLVLSNQSDVEVQQLDETLTFSPNADRTFSVVDVQQSAPRPVDAGPEVVGISISGTQMTVTFDSDLKPDSVAGITLGNSTATYANRVATFDLSGDQAGQVLTLTIPASVQDLSGRPTAQAAAFQIVVPAST